MRWLTLLFAVMLAACSTLPPPARPDDLCRIFQQRPKWYESARSSSRHWGIPVPVLMATMRQESSYQAKVRPPRRYYLGVIPGGRASDAYGYAQAKEDIWARYRSDAHHGWASRDDFADAVDFIGWYDHQSVQHAGIPADDAYHLYLSYHEGLGGYQRHSYRNKPWLQALARHVAYQSRRYEQQLSACRDALDASLHHWF